MIVVRDLTKVYPDLQQGEIQAVKGLSFQAEPGEVYGLRGPNGAGKTTVLRIISTMLKPTGGQVTVNGFDVVEQSYDVRRNIGFVSNNTGGYDRMTAVEMVEFFGRLYGLSEERLQERIEIVFDQLQMNGFRERLGGKMSTGMGQKVSIARAIIHDPPVLVFDEATVGLDVLVARSLIETIGEFQDQGKCIIFSTHHMREVERLCERVAIMYEGAMLAEGNVKELSEIHAQDDLEDLFFDLISNYDRKKESQAISTEEMDA